MISINYENWKNYCKANCYYCPNGYYYKWKSITYNGLTLVWEVEVTMKLNVTR